MAKCNIDGKGLEVCKAEEWKGDSDDSDFKEDSFFDFTCSPRLIKLRWRYTKTVEVQDKEETATATIRFKLKGKGTACSGADDEYASQTAVCVEKLTKKTYYKVQSKENEEKPMGITTLQENWKDYNRKWQCENFDLSYSAVVGVDEVMVESKAGNFAENVMFAFAVAYFMHPADVLAKTETDLINAGRDKLACGS